MRKVPTRLEAGAIPVEALAAFAEREGRRLRPIYLAHKWFARRLGSAFRALLVAAVVPKERDFWRAYYSTGDLCGKTVLDPFVGGGTSVVEAARLGAISHGVDVDPVACAVSRLELDAGGLPDLKDALATLRASVGEFVLPFHRRADDRGASWTVVHHFWVQTVTCMSCETVFDAHPNFRLAFAPEGKRQWVVCAECGTIVQRDRNVASVRCGCGHRTTIERGTVKHGSARCPSCRHEEPLIDLGRRTKVPPTFRLFACEAIPTERERCATHMSERHFFAATAEDNRRYDAAQRSLTACLSQLADWIPRWTVSATGRSDDRLIAYGYTSYNQLFNARQTLHLALLAQAIDQQEEPLRRVLAMAFSNHLVTNCMQSAYAAGWRRLVPLFSVRAFRHIPRPVELNPWLEGTGRGTFPNAVRKIERAAAFAREPQELARDGGFKTVKPRSPSAAHTLHNRDARDLSPFPDASVDIVLTDPPYFDNIAYSELSEFYVPWLSLFGIVGNGRDVRRLVVQSLRSRRGDRAKTRAFTEGLTAVFCEVERVLKRDGVVVFTYRHSRAEAWASLASAIAASHLRVVQVLPMQGEAGVGPHAHPGAALWDAVLVLRKREAGPLPTPLAVTQTQLNAAERHARRWERRLGKALPGRFKAADALNFRRAAAAAASLGMFGAGRPAASRELGEVLSSLGIDGGGSDAGAQEAGDLELPA